MLQILFYCSRGKEATQPSKSLSNSVNRETMSIDLYQIIELPFGISADQITSISEPVPTMGKHYGRVACRSMNISRHFVDAGSWCR